MRSSLSVVCSALTSLVENFCETCPCAGGPDIPLGEWNVREVLRKHGWEPAELMRAVRASVSARWLYFSSLGYCITLLEEGERC